MYGLNGIDVTVAVAIPISTHKNSSRRTNKHEIELSNFQQFRSASETV